MYTYIACTWTLFTAGLPYSRPTHSLHAEPSGTSCQYLPGREWEVADPAFAAVAAAIESTSSSVLCLMHVMDLNVHITAGCLAGEVTRRGMSSSGDEDVYGCGVCYDDLRTTAGKIRSALSRGACPRDGGQLRGWGILKTRRTGDCACERASDERAVCCGCLSEEKCMQVPFGNARKDTSCVQFVIPTLAGP
jgi:hypothetical protein